MASTWGKSVFFHLKSKHFCYLFIVYVNFSILHKNAWVTHTQKLLDQDKWSIIITERDIWSEKRAKCHFRVEMKHWRIVRLKGLWIWLEVVAFQFGTYFKGMWKKWHNNNSVSSYVNFFLHLNFLLLNNWGETNPRFFSTKESARSNWRFELKLQQNI